MIIAEATVQEPTIPLTQESRVSSGPAAESAFPFAPIHKLPPEILSKVFIDLVDSDIQIQDIFRILQVCKTWHRTALETHQLFIHIYHDFNAPAWPPTADLNPNIIIPKFLRLSGKLPINIKIDFDSYSEWRFISQYEGACMSTACLGVIRQHLPRYRSLHFLSMEQKELETLIPNGTELYLPLLHDVVIDFWAGHRYGAVNYTPPLSLGKWIVPNLRTLKIGRHGDYNREIITTSPLTFIKMIPENITRLELSYIAWDINDYINILRMLPNLKTCLMHTDYRGNMGAQLWGRPSSLVHLTELQIFHRDPHRRRGAGNFGMNPLLQVLCVPQLETFLLSEKRTFEERGTYTSGFLSIFSTNLKGVLPLKRLTLKNIYIPADAFLLVFYSATLLEYLSLVGLHSELEETIVTSLTPNTTESWKWSRLERIQLGNCTDKVIKMLKAHMFSYEHGEGTGLHALEFEAPSFWGTEKQEIRRLQKSQNHIKVTILPRFEEEND